MTLTAKSAENAKAYRDDMFRAHLWWVVAFGDGGSMARYFDVAATIAHERYLRVLERLKLAGEPMP